MDGLLLVDKPSGPTSHDVVARVRRALREKRIGHTGTLDPLATGLLPLVLGKATRLAQFLTASDKSYDAVVRLGFATDTADSQGEAIGAIYAGPWPLRDAIDAALQEFRGAFLQQPPAFSAKKIDGKRSYAIARTARAERIAKPSDARLKPRATDEPDLPDAPDPPAQNAMSALPAPASVTTHRLEIVSVGRDIVTLTVDCSAGFYIRSLAHDLGDRLGTGAHLTALRRTRSGAFTLARAIALETAERDPAAAAAAIVPMADMLPDAPRVTLTEEGVRHVMHGRAVGPADWREAAGPQPPAPSPGLIRQATLVRLLNQSGELVALARPSGETALLHPFAVLV